jgi:hypothetical protein
MKSNEVGTTLKHPETINGNVKNLSKRIKMKDKGNATFNITIRERPKSIWGNEQSELESNLSRTLSEPKLCFEVRRTSNLKVQVRRTL